MGAHMNPQMQLSHPTLSASCATIDTYPLPYAPRGLKISHRRRHYIATKGIEYKGYVSVINHHSLTH